jgi:cardiolipin synthase
MWRSYYEELLRYGVKIYEYESGIRPTSALIDEEWFMVGSQISSALDAIELRVNALVPIRRPRRSGASA